MTRHDVSEGYWKMTPTYMLNAGIAINLQFVQIYSICNYNKVRSNKTRYPCNAAINILAQVFVCNPYTLRGYPNKMYYIICFFCTKTFKNATAEESYFPILQAPVFPLIHLGFLSFLKKSKLQTQYLYSCSIILAHRKRLILDTQE